MFNSVSFPPMPAMPQITDFQKVCEDPGWVAEHYDRAIHTWRLACIEWRKACSHIATVTKP